MKYLYPLAFLLLIISFCFNRNKSVKALKIAWKKFASILPMFLTMICLMAVLNLIFPFENLGDILSGHNHWIGLALAVAIGSLIFVPGFVAYPLSAVLLENGVPYFVIAGFTTSLMLVGFASLPVEITYFGKKTAIWRNILGFCTSLVIALVVGILYGEIKL